MSELYPVNLNPNKYDTYKVASTEDANPIAQQPVVIDEIGGSSKKSSSIWDYLQSKGKAVAAYFQPGESDGRVGFAACNPRDSGWDDGIELPPQQTGLINASLAEGAYFIQSDELYFDLSAGAKNLQNTPLRLYVQADSTLVDGLQNLPYQPGFINVIPRDDANFLFCYESEWSDEFGMRMPTDGLGTGPDHWVTDPADLVDRIGHENYPYAYCWDWSEFNVSETYVAYLRVQCERTDGQVVYNETPIVTLEDNVLNPEVFGPPTPLQPTIQNPDGSVYIDLPFYSDENNGIRCQNSDGTLNLKIWMAGLGRVTAPPNISLQVETGIRVRVESRE